MHRLSTPYLAVRAELPEMLAFLFAWVPGRERQRLQTFSSVSNPINNVVVEQRSGASWGRMRYFVITPDRGMNQVVRKALARQGVPRNQVFTVWAPASALEVVDGQGGVGRITRLRPEGRPQRVRPRAEGICQGLLEERQEPRQVLRPLPDQGLQKDQEPHERRVHEHRHKRTAARRQVRGGHAWVPCPGHETRAEPGQAPQAEDHQVPAAIVHPRSQTRWLLLNRAGRRTPAPRRAPPRPRVERHRCRPWPGSGGRPTVSTPRRAGEHAPCSRPCRRCRRSRS